MSFLVNKLKITAAAGSMHQFCPAVRSLLPPGTDDRVVEAVTAFLYLQTAQDCFGRRFTTRLHTALRERFKFGDAVEIDLRISRIDTQRRAFEQAMQAHSATDGENDAYAGHVHCAIRALLAEAGGAFEDIELVRQLFPRFEETARRIKGHLDGIRGQSDFMMKRA